jgi:sugar phosphate isomerase/epimerase
MTMKGLTSQAVSRRSFVKAAALGAAALGTGLPSVFAADKKIPVGLELYSVRTEMDKSVSKTIEAVAKIGYKGVEFAGYYNQKAADLRKMLDDNGIVCCGSHSPLETIQPENINATIDFAKTIGNKFIIVPYMDPKTKQGWLDMVKLFNSQAEKLKAAGIRLGYHAHSHDFAKVDGEVPWDIFFGGTREDVVMQLDTANCMDGGADPVAVLKKYSKRAATIHIKEWGGAKGAVIGEGKVNFKSVFDVCEHNGVTEWYVLEYEDSGDPIESVRKSFEALKKMGKV